VSADSFELRRLVDTLADPPLAPPVLVDGLIRKGELVGIGAPRGVGKSWLALNIAALVGSGDGYVFGRLQVTTKVPVLIFHGETPPWQAALRWKMLRDQWNSCPDITEVFEPWHVGVRKITTSVLSLDGGSRVSEETREGRLDERVRAAVKETGAGLVILDPWATYYNGEENSNDDVEAAMGQLRDLADSTGAAIVIVHHLKKGGEERDAEDLWRGAGRLADAVRTRVTLLPRFSPKQAAERKLSPSEARRHCSVSILRSEEATPGFNAVLDDNGWWSRTPDGPDNNSSSSKANTSLDALEVLLRFKEDGCASFDDVASALDLTKLQAGQLLGKAKRASLVVESEDPAGARIFRLSDGVQS